ncbi:acyltransferase [Chitinophaga horti]|uniref:Acyltransferase n=1 Tax=Chitinophaga horti TaxID=2920382 RepID=A0ABY6JA68_9BACT|nr:acyltransferase [Chitinophaga horti]UYQ95237.1 acyltransferase [Chitinophaga horti]
MSNVLSPGATATPTETAAPQKPKKEFLNYIHYFRGIAIFYVVAAHILVDWPEGSTMRYVLDAFFQNSTILFLFIAGYLFQHLSGKFEYKDYLIKKFQNVHVPYLVLSAPLIIYRVVQQDIPGFTLEDHPDFGTWPAWKQVAEYLLHGGHLQPYWFIPMITLMYLLAPVLLYIDRNPKLYWVLVPLFALSFIIKRPPLSYTFTMLAHFTSVYVFGMFMSHFKKEYLEFAKKYYIPITVVSLALTVMLCTPYPLFTKYYSELNFVQKLSLTGLFIYWLWRWDAKMPKPLLNLLANLSFGLFFVHYFFVLAMRGGYIFLFGREWPGNILSWTINFAITFTLSVLFLMAVKKVTGKNSKYFVGC